MPSISSSTPKITETLVKKLIEEQFPKWSHLPIKSVEISGIDNRTFHLGQEMSVRLPSAEKYALQVEKEQKWLKLLAPHLSLSIPTPITQGIPSDNYPWNWSIYKWIDGESANNLLINDLHLQQIGLDLANFLNELQKIESQNGPLPGSHNFFRGDHLSIYDTETRATIYKLQDIIDVNKITSIWEEAISSKWEKNPIWVHGDFSSGNIIIKDNLLTAIIDFGCMAVGDPACDLTIAWTFLKDESRKIFKSNLKLDQKTWARARGWALWKALITINKLEDKTSLEAIKNFQIINDITEEYEIEKSK